MVEQPSEDLFDDSRMSFGEHLEELRKVLVRSLIGVAIGCIFGFYYANPIIQILNQPLIDALVEYKNDRAREKFVQREGFVPPELLPWFDQEKLAPETVMVDGGQLISILREFNPDFFESIDLDPYRFRSSHLDRKKLPELCQRMLDPPDSDSESIEFLFDQLTVEQQAQVRRISDLDSATDADVGIMTEVFRGLISNNRLFEEPVFESQLGNPSQGWLSLLMPAQKVNPLKQVKQKLEDSFDEDVNQRLNRVLITSLFSYQMPEVRLDLEPIQIWRKLEVHPQSLNPMETFLIWLKAGLIAGLLLASPWVLYQLWSFVAAGLYPHEKKYVHIFLPISLTLFFSGAALAFCFVFQPVLAFLFTFNAQMGIEPQPRINEWLSFVMFLPLGFGIAFQLPLVMLFLNRINVFSVSSYLEKWRIAVMVIFVLSMLLTPADPISMILLAFPLTLLYFLGIGLCHWFPATGNPFEPLIESENQPATSD